MKRANPQYLLEGRSCGCLSGTFLQFLPLTDVIILFIYYMDNLRVPLYKKRHRNRVTAFDQSTRGQQLPEELRRMIIPWNDSTNLRIAMPERMNPFNAYVAKRRNLDRKSVV